MIELLSNFQNEILKIKKEFNINYTSVPYFGKASPIDIINQKDFSNYNMEFQVYFENYYYYYTYIEAGRNTVPNILCKTKDIDELKYCVFKNLFGYTADIEARKSGKKKQEIIFNFLKKINEDYAVRYIKENG